MVSPEYDFLELVERGKRGRLKIYVGCAAGVGKTRRLLEEASALGRRGADVVIGLVEPHGRADVAALTEGLEVLPRRVVEMRGARTEELDLDGVLARGPQVVVIDELAHTNPPGFRNLRRYQDVQTLLEAGVSVLTALNVQHLESLN